MKTSCSSTVCTNPFLHCSHVTAQNDKKNIIFKCLDSSWRVWNGWRKHRWCRYLQANVLAQVYSRVCHFKKTKHKNGCTYSLEFPSFPFFFLYKYFPWRSFPVYIANSVIRCDGSARTGRGLIDFKPHFGGWRTRSCKTSFVFCSYIIPFPALSWTCPCVPNHVIYFHIGLFVYCYGGGGCYFHMLMNI